MRMVARNGLKVYENYVKFGLLSRELQIERFSSPCKWRATVSLKLDESI
jgi:hypothetical protein